MLRRKKFQEITLTYSILCIISLELGQSRALYIYCSRIFRQLSQSSAVFRQIGQLARPSLLIPHKWNYSTRTCDSYSKSKADEKTSKEILTTSALSAALPHSLLLSAKSGPHKKLTLLDPRCLSTCMFSYSWTACKALAVDES